MQLPFLLLFMTLVNGKEGNGPYQQIQLLPSQTVPVSYYWRTIFTFKSILDYKPLSLSMDVDCIDTILEPFQLDKVETICLSSRVTCPVTDWLRHNSFSLFCFKNTYAMHSKCCYVMQSTHPTIYSRKKGWNQSSLQQFSGFKKMYTIHSKVFS